MCAGRVCVMCVRDADVPLLRSACNADLLFLLFLFFFFFSFFFVPATGLLTQYLKTGCSESDHSLVGLHECSPTNIFGDNLH